jgi:hypothetical protein
MIVTREARAAFERDGYLVLTPDVSENVRDCDVVSERASAYRGVGRTA